MSAKPNFFRLGIFILGAVAILVAALLVFGSGQLFRPKILAETYVDGTVQGIDVGTQVKFRGVLVGKVTDIDFVFNIYQVPETAKPADYIVLVIQLDREVFPGMFREDISPLLDKQIEKGLRARIQPQGVTGLNYVDIDFVDATRFPVLKPAWHPRYYYIPYAPGEITSFLDSINKIMRDVENLNLAEISSKSVELLDNLNTTVTQADLGKLSTDLQGLSAQIRKTIEEANVPELSADMRKFVAELEASNTELRKILSNLEPATRIDSSKVRSILNNVNAATQNIEQLTNSLKSKPSLLLWGTPKEEKERQRRR